MTAVLVQKLSSTAITSEPTDQITLGYEDRFVRRKQLITDGGIAILLDFEHMQSVEPGQVFEAENGMVIQIVAAIEALTQVRGPDLARYAWHVGNRHTPCKIEADRLLIQRNHVLSDMLAKLGADVLDIEGPFEPEGGAYGHGRTMGHRHD